MFSDVQNVTITEMEVILVDDYKYLEAAIKLYGTYNKNRKRCLKIAFNFLKFFEIKLIFLCFIEI